MHDDEVTGIYVFAEHLMVGGAECAWTASRHIRVTVKLLSPTRYFRDKVALSFGIRLVPCPL